nr:hypothetical protein [Trichoderma harzianum]
MPVEDASLGPMKEAKQASHPPRRGELCKVTNPVHNGEPPQWRFLDDSSNSNPPACKAKRI